MADEQSKKRGLQDDMAVAIQNKRAALTATSNPLASSPSEQDLYIKLICPASIAGLIIGKSGTTIGNLNRTTGAKIQVSQNQDVYPGTTDKVIVVNGNRECIGVALKELVTLIGEAPSRRGPGGKPLMDANGNPMTPPNKTAEGDFVISVLIPKMASGILIGKQGIVVKEMSANSNCKMQLGDNKDLYMTGERAFIVSSPTVPSLVLGVHAVMMQLMSDQRVRIYANKTVVYANTGGPMGGGGSGGGMTAPLPPPPQQRQGYPHHHQQQGAYPQLNVPTAGGPPMRNQIPQQQQQPQAPVTMGYNELGQLVPNPPQVVMGAPQQQQQQYPPNAGMAGMPPQMGVPVQQMQPQYPPQNVLQQQQYPPQKGASQQKQKQKQPPAQREVPPQQQAPYMDTVSSPGMAPVNAVMGGMPPPHQGAMQQQIPQQQIPQQQMPQQQMPQQQMTQQQLYPPQNAIQQQQQYPPQNTMQQQQYPPQNSLQQQQYPPQKGATLQQQQQQYHEQKTVHQQKGKQHQSQSMQKGPPQQHQQQQYPPQQQYQQQQQHQPGMMQQQYQQHQQQQPGMMQQQYPQQPGAMQQALPAQQQQQQQQQYPQQAMQGMAQPQMQIPVQVPPAIGMNGGTGGGYMMPNVPGPQQQMYVQNLPQTQQQPLQQQQQYGRGAPRGGAR